MSQLNRPDQETNIIANIFTNILNLISGNKMQAQLKNLNDSCPNILSDKDQASGYVGTSAANEIIAGYYRESIGKVAILNKAEAATLVANKGYLVTDATGDGTFIGVIAKDTVSLYPTAIDLENNTFGTYDINTGVFTAAASGGNANIVTLDTVALQALQSGSTLSQTTFYINTNAVSATRKLQIYAIANNTNVVAAIDMTTGEVGTYDITGDVFVLTVPKFVSFKKVLTPTNINAGGTFAVSECPAVTGAAWEVISASANLVGTVPYDTAAAINLKTNGTSKPQFTDNANVLAVASRFGKLIDSNTFAASTETNMKSNEGLLVELDQPNSTGDGTLTIYGIARLITL